MICVTFCVLSLSVYFMRYLPGFNLSRRISPEFIFTMYSATCIPKIEKKVTDLTFKLLSFDFTIIKSFAGFGNAINTPSSDFCPALTGSLLRDCAEIVPEKRVKKPMIMKEDNNFFTV